jgi:O-6-methylguanine DNA methyltransferase
MAGLESILIARTSWGNISIAVKDGLVVSCNLPNVKNTPARTFSIRSMEIKNPAPANRTTLAVADKFLRATLAGTMSPIPDLAFPEGTALQRKVWKFLHAMKKGEVVTYGELARKIGYPRAARAIGQACGANPIPLIIPCHRVLGANGAMGGFSSGMAWKIFLLEKEAIDLSSTRRLS